MEENKKGADRQEISADLFVLTDSKSSDREKIATKSLTFWQDASLRLRKNKAAMVGFWLIVLLMVFSVLAPSSFFAFKNADGTPFRYDAAPVLADEDGNEIKKEDIAYLPPRIPVLEKLGIFDGMAILERGSWDVFIGNLPKNDEFKDLGKPQNRKKLVERLGIAYHPFDVNIVKITEKEGQKYITLKVLKDKKEVEIPLKDMISEYSRFQPDNFKLISTKVDDKGVEMLTVEADEYAIKNVKNLYFWFGTDKLALDIWTRLWIGVGISLLIAVISMCIDFFIGIIYGTIAGFYGGTTVDNIMMRFAEIWGSIPSLVLMIIMLSIEKKIGLMLKNVFNPIIQVFNPSAQLTNNEIRFLILIFAMSLSGWIGVARVVRAQILKLRDQEFILASRTLGASKVRLMRKHLFPNIIGQLMVMATFSIPGAIFYEAFLSFIGLGLPIPMSSLGVLVSEGYKAIQSRPTMLLIPAAIMSILMLSINLLANGLRDALDPRMR